MDIPVKSNGNNDCVHCGKTIGPSGKYFCSIDCHQETRHLKSLRVYECALCVNLFIRKYKPSDGPRTYCSRRCAGDAKRTGYTVKGGYRATTWRGHPLANGYNQIYEHWLVLYELNPDFAVWAKEHGWTIHHLNSIRDDNRPENLEWRAPGRHPTGWSVEDMIEAIRHMGYTVTKSE